VFVKLLDDVRRDAKVVREIERVEHDHVPRSVGPCGVNKVARQGRRIKGVEGVRNGRRHSFEVDSYAVILLDVNALGLRAFDVYLKIVV